MEFRVQPTASELLSVVALLWEENDSLRSQIGSLGIHFAHRSFTPEDLQRGHGYGPSAVIKPNGSLIIAMES